MQPRLAEEIEKYNLNRREPGEPEMTQCLASALSAADAHL